VIDTGRAEENAQTMSLTERLHLTRAETFFAVVLPLLGIAAVVSIIISIRTTPGFLTWSGSVADFAMFASLEAVLIKVLRTPSRIQPAISNRAAIELVTGSTCIVILGTILAFVAISLFNGDERAINDDVIAILGLLLIFSSASLGFMQRSRLNQHHEAANSTR
jgi:hypothetical protein